MKGTQRTWASIIRYQGLAYRLDVSSLSNAGRLYSSRIAFVVPSEGIGSRIIQRLLIYANPNCTEFLGHADAHTEKDRYRITENDRSGSPQEPGSDSSTG